LQTLIKIAAGQRLTDIANELMLSVYRARVLEKLQMGSNAELTAYAIHNQLI
jgi:DNA-binding NarL/FixJ family response regulator